MMKYLCAIILAHSSLFSYATETLNLNEKLLKNKDLQYKSHRGNGKFDTTLSMNVPYQPVKLLREELSKAIGLELKFFNLWDPEGEAHITVVTPVEYYDIIKPYVPIDRMEAIANELAIQKADFSVLGLGRGQSKLEGHPQETYFIIVDAPKLLKIRQKIHQEFVSKGGVKDAWNPNEFYPHITVGFTLRDLHLSDGVIKDVKHSLDPRYKLNLRGATP